MTKATKGTVLVIDDEKGLRDMLCYGLGGKGWSVEAVEGGGQAVARLRSSRFDLAVCDIMMPDMDGVETLKALKELQPDIQVVMVTGYATLETAVKTMKLGAFDYIAKPYDLEELVANLDRAQEHRRLARRVAELEDLERLRAHMLVSLSRELKAPIEAIAREARSGAAAPGGLARIEAGARRMLESVEAVLYYARLDGGLVPPFVEEFDLSELLREVAENLQGFALERPLELTLRAPARLPLKSDRILLKHILVSLVGDAIDKTEPGPLALSAERGEGAPGVRIRLTEPGARRGGQSLPGLPLTKRLIELVGGTISVQSAQGKGAVFTVALPETTPVG